ncbi:MAG: hypothetical protein AAF483_30055, partial [Planctomycetota bacterium]
MNRTPLLSILLLVFAPSNVFAEVIFDDSFAGTADGPIANQADWSGQPNWTISGGKATTPGTAFHRAQRFAGFRVEDNEAVRIT